VDHSLPEHYNTSSTTPVVASPGVAAISAASAQHDTTKPHEYCRRFYAIFANLIATTLLSAPDGSIVSTALPTISQTLKHGHQCRVGCQYLLPDWVSFVFQAQCHHSANE
jgi:hypothetical protein